MLRYPPLCPVRRLSATIVVAVLMSSLPVLAQQDAGTLRVLVQDPGGVVPGANVVVTNVSTNVATSQVSNDQGYAIFSPIPRGTYSVSVTLQGFRAVRISNVTIDVSQNRLLPVTLAVADIQETVEVTAQAAVIQTEDASLGQVLKSQVIEQLPLAGRRYTDLALLTPGATESTADPNLRGPGWLVVNGNSHIMNNFLLDGFDNNQNTQNMQSRSAQVVSPSPDTLGEFKVITNGFSAEFGRAAGAVINASIKSGTNQFHGSGWIYNRNAALAANKWENNWRGLDKDDLKWTQPGGTLGGPIRRDRLFFFGDYEGFFSKVTNAPFVTVPTLAERNGDFSALTVPILDPVTGQPFPGNIIPASRFDPLAKKILDEVFPAPNNVWPTPGSGGRPINNYTRRVPTTRDTHKWDLRADYNHSAKDRFFARYSFNQDYNFKTPTMPGLADTGAQDGGRQYARNQAVGASWNRILSARAVNEFRVGYNKTAADFSHATVGMTTGTEFGFRGLPSHLDSVGGLPRITITGYQSIGVGNFRPQYHNPFAYQVTDALTWARGAQTWKFGFDYRYKEDDWVDLAFRTVAYNFDSRFTNDGIADFLLGYVQSLGGSNFFVAQEVQQNYSAFVQNDWKIRPNLTLNLGLRYEYTTPLYGRDPYVNSNIDYAARQLVIAEPAPIVYGGRRAESRYAFQRTDFNNWGPRLGVAYQATDRLVVRSGFGAFYNGENITGTTAGELLVNAPNLYRVTLQRAGSGPPPLLLSDAVPASFLDTSAISPTNLSFNSRWPDFEAATVMQWNVATEYLVTDNSTIEIAYVGNKGRNLDVTISPNNTPWGIDGSIVANRPFPEFGTLGMRAPLGHSDYQALQTKYEHRFNGGWYGLASYTFAAGHSEAPTFGAGGGGSQNYDWSHMPSAIPILESAFMEQLTRHRLSVSSIARVPVGRGQRFGKGMNRVLDSIIGGWQSQVIFTAKSGLPLNVTLARTGTDPFTGRAYSYLASSGGDQLRPDAIGDPLTGIDPKDDRTRYLDINAFKMPAINTPGNAPRNMTWGPGFWNVDIGLTKRFEIATAQTIDIRIEAFNAFNTVNFRNPEAVLGASNFGQILSSYDPRQVQLALRYGF
ncbi:MAG TPA: TonB-dependent receptor [Vicinamibacterales bacterium]|nr:TonB-dependent receptor [Vicinamibacterales bacterium]